jgi:Holliday junction resolvase RusA-like endonuclease
MRLISFAVPMIPTAKGRPRAAVIAGSARIFTPRETVRAEQEFVAFALVHAPVAPIREPVALRLVFVLPIPESRPAWWQAAAAAGAIYPRGPKDVDNMAKLVQDALNRSGRFWGDDAQVVTLEARKIYGLRPETRVELEVVHEPTRQEWAVDAGLFGAGA